jgi:hypothetical protein
MPAHLFQSEIPIQRAAHLNMQRGSGGHRGIPKLEESSPRVQCAGSKFHQSGRVGRSLISTRAQRWPACYRTSLSCRILHQDRRSPLELRTQVHCALPGKIQGRCFKHPHPYTGSPAANVVVIPCDREHTVFAGFFGADIFPMF